MNNFITCELTGRLGNQMFEIAHAFSQALTHNRELRIPTLTKQGPRWGDPLLYKNTMFRKLELRDDAHISEMHRVTGTFHYTNYNPHETLPTVFSGYFQSEKFFKKHSYAIKWLYEPPLSFIQKAYQQHPQLGADNTVAIHVRRGDYTVQTARFPLVTKEYVLEAMKQIPEATHCFVISDDILWCKQQFQDDKFIFSNYIDPSEAIWFMSLCKHFVLSNSTFSWWGAYLSRHNTSKTIIPSVWFGPGFVPKECWDTKDVPCETWTVLPTQYVEPGLIVPI